MLCKSCLQKNPDGQENCIKCGNPLGPNAPLPPRSSKSKWIAALTLVIALSIAKFITSAINGGEHLNTSKSLKPLAHHIPVPDGYIDILPLESPAHKYYQEIQNKWKEINYMPTPNIISVLVKQSDLAVYYAGGPSPMEKGFCYISFNEANNVIESLGSVKAEILKQTDTIDKKIRESENQFSNYMKIGKIHHLGIVNEWNSGFVYGIVTPIKQKTGNIHSEKPNLLLSAFATQPKGFYTIVSDTTIQKESDYKLAVSDISNLAQKFTISNAAQE